MCSATLCETKVNIFLVEFVCVLNLELFMGLLFARWIRAQTATNIKMVTILFNVQSVIEIRFHKCLSLLLSDVKSVRKAVLPAMKVIDN